MRCPAGKPKNEHTDNMISESRMRNINDVNLRQSRPIQMMVEQMARPATVTATIANTATNRQPSPSVYCPLQTTIT